MRNDKKHNSRRKRSIFAGVIVETNPLEEVSLTSVK